MMNRVLVLIIFGMMSLVCRAQEPDHFTMKELRVVGDQATGRSPDAEEVVRNVARLLNLLKGRTARLDLHNKGVLIELAVFVHFTLPAEEKKAAEDRRRKLVEKYADVPFRPDMDGEELLYYSAGILGIPIDQEGMMAYARNSGNPFPLRLRALKAILGQKSIQPGLEQDLIALGQDEINYSADGHVGPRTGRRIYPIRDASAEVLKKMKDDPPAEIEEPRPSKRPVSGSPQPARDEGRTPQDVPPDTVAGKGAEAGQDSRITPAVWIGATAAVAGLLWLLLKQRNKRSGK